MGVVLLQILQWILRIILFLLILVLVLGAIIMIVPIRYRADWDFLEKKPGVRGKITWFFYLIYMRFYYEEEFRMQVRVCGFKVYDSGEGEQKPKKLNSNKNNDKTAQENVESDPMEAVHENVESDPMEATHEVIKNDNIDDLAAWEKEMEAEAKEEAELAKQAGKQNLALSEKDKSQENQKDCWERETENSTEKVKKSLSEKIENIKSKIQDLIQKLKDIIAKIQDGKLKAEHYLELWNRKETQITFGRAKTKLGKMIKAVLPEKWKITGEIGFEDPSTTGQLMGVLGAMYPIFGNRVQITPNFEEQVIDVKGNLKGHISLGNLCYQVISLLLNRHCFKFIKLIFDELGGSKKGKKKQKVQKL